MVFLCCPIQNKHGKEYEVIAFVNLCKSDTTKRRFSKTTRRFIRLKRRVIFLTRRFAF